MVLPLRLWLFEFSLSGYHLQNHLKEFLHLNVFLLVKSLSRGMTYGHCNQIKLNHLNSFKHFNFGIKTRQLWVIQKMISPTLVYGSYWCIWSWNQLKISNITCNDIIRKIIMDTHTLWLRMNYKSTVRLMWILKITDIQRFLNYLTLDCLCRNLRCLLSSCI